MKHKTSVRVMRKSSFPQFLHLRKMKKFKNRFLTELKKSSEIKYAELCRIAILFRRAVMQKLKKWRIAKYPKLQKMKNRKMLRLPFLKKRSFLRMMKMKKTINWLIRYFLIGKIFGNSITFSEVVRLQYSAVLVSALKQAELKAKN